MRKEECYFLGRITRRHGLSGNVILKMDTDQPEFYSKMESMFIEINGLLVPFFLINCHGVKGDSLNILFKNSTEALVDQVIGKEVYQPLSSCQNYPENNSIITKLLVMRLKIPKEILWSYPLCK